jgi:predicted RecB family nuclease
MRQSVTDGTFAAFLHCETKAFLFNEGAAGTRSDVNSWELRRARAFKASATDWLRSTVSEKEYFVGMPPARILEQGLYQIILDPLMETSEVRSQPDALWLMPSGLEGSGVLYSPVRFIRHEKLSTIDKMMLAFDAIAIVCVTGRMPRSGKLIHGSQFATVTVPLAKLVESTQLCLTKVLSQQANGTPPPLILNKHCPVCEFRSRCREAALEKDDLSLLANMTAKERKTQNDKGIFTVAQLSYTFRPRRRRRFKSSQATKHEPALKALAIRKRRIHVVGTPNFSVPKGAVYLDVEGVPDRDFYYLVGLRWRDADKDIQRSFWADTASEEHEMWLSCLLALKLLNAPYLIHYGSYETQFLKRMKERYARGPEDGAFIDQLISSSFNLLSLTYAQIYFPTYTNGLKDVARYLGFEWSEQDGSGLKTLDWRSEWEATRDASLKQKLLTYNAQDCQAAQRVAETLAGICSNDPSMQPETVGVNSLECDHPLRFGPLQYALPDFKTINEAAYWDYQRSRIYVRSSDRLRRLSKTGRRRCRPSVEPPVNKSIQANENRPALCPKCNSTKFYRNGRFSKVVYDLRFTPAGVRRWVVRHCFNRYQCRNCKHGYNELPRQETYGKSLKAYVLYQVIELRISQHAVARTAGAIFGLRMSATSINCIKISATKQYETTYRSILQRIVAGPLVHADETQVMIKGKARYVWVFTSLEDVAYVYSESRDASTAQDLLSSFGGVLVSDFYAGYDSINCAQQKCLIHLLRDINEHVLSEPFNKEMEELAHSFASLLRPMVDAVDRFGLKARHLRTHRPAVDRFYSALSKREYTSDVAASYKKRFEKNRDRLFTFLDHDGVPWNNNNAEHAIKAFARLRNAIGANSTPKGVREYLVLLSVSETCMYKGVDFLHFLRSGETDIDVFAGRPAGRVRPLYL